MSESPAVQVVGVVRPWTTLSATGPDAVSWLNGLVTCDVTRVSDELAAWGLLLSKRGKILAELTVVRAGDALLLGTPGDSAELTRALDDFLVMEDVELENLGRDAAWIQLHGSGAFELAARARPNGAALARADWFPVGGAVLTAPAQDLEQCVQRLRGDLGKEGASGGTGGGDGVQWLDESAWQAWRVAHGIPEFGIDFGPEDNPHQAGLDRRAVSWTKGCYLGQEVVCMQDMRGKVKRRLAKLTLPEALLVASGDEVNSESGDSIGSVTSVMVAPLAPGQPRAALAQLKAPYFEPGSTVYLGQTALTTAALWA